VSDRLPTLLAGGLWLAAALTGCGSEPPAPVARLTVSPAEVELAYPGSAILSAEWEMTAPLSGEPAGATAGAEAPWVFVHLLDDSGAVVRTFDHQLPFPWRRGESRPAPLELWQSALAPPLPAGDYAITVGLYRPRDGRRWTLETEAPEAGAAEYRVAEVRVLPPSSGIEVAFDGSWWPAQEGSDRQVMARRWLQRAGAVEITGLSQAVLLELGLLLPEAGDGERLVLVDGAELSRLRISSPCAAREESLETPGHHRVELALEAPEEGRCTVRLEPSFVLVDLETLASRSVALERLSMSPARD
jgi:hypothetical protein